MTVSSLPKNPEHPSLFGAEDLGAPLTMAACRNWCGDFYEEAAAVMLGGVRLRTDSRATICPDIRVSPYRSSDLADRYYEVKSCGANGETLVYEARRLKDRAFVDEGNTLSVALWRHDYRVGMDGGMTVSELRSRLALATLSLTIVPFEVYEEVMTTKPLQDFTGRGERRSRPGGERRGYGSYGYTQGRRCRVRVFTEMAPKKTRVAGLAAYGQAIPSFEVFGW